MRKRIISQTEFDKMLIDHGLWLRDTSKGKQAIFENIILKDISVRGVCLNNSKFSNSEFDNSRFDNSRFYNSRFDNSEFTGICSILNCNYRISSFLYGIIWRELSDDLTLELMRHDAEFTGMEAMDTWVNGGSCPYEGMQRDFLFQEKKQLWKEGKPKLRGKELLIALFDSQGIEHDLK